MEQPLFKLIGGPYNGRHIPLSRGTSLSFCVGGWRGRYVNWAWQPEATQQRQLPV